MLEAIASGLEAIDIDSRLEALAIRSGWRPLLVSWRLSGGEKWRSTVSVGWVVHWRPRKLFASKRCFSYEYLG